MKVIIVGCGRIGFMAARAFIDQGCTDVSIVSQSPIEDMKETFINSMEFEYQICFFGFEIGIWMKREIKP